MSQEPYNRNDKSNLPRFSGNRKDDDPNQPPKKGPRFSIYWIYAIIFAVLIGFQLWGGPFSSNTATIGQDVFQQALKDGDVDKYVVVTNRSIVKVTLKKEALNKPPYNTLLKKGINGKVSEDGPHMSFEIVSGDSFKDDMRKFFADNPGVKMWVPFQRKVTGSASLYHFYYLYFFLLAFGYC